MEIPQLSEGDAEPEEAEVVDREERVPALVAIPADQPFDRVVVRHQRRDLRLGDPLQQRLVPGVEVGAHRVDLHGIRVAVPFEDLRGETGVQQEHVARLHDDAVRRHDLLECRPVDPAPVVTQMVGEVDEDPSALHAVERHVLHAEVVREGEVLAAVPRRVGLRSDEVDAGAVPVVVDGLLDPVAIGVELRADVGERIPLRRVLQREGHDVVGPHVDVTGVPVVPHLAHVDVVEGAGISLHVLGRRENRRVAPLVQGGATRVVERQAQAEADSGLDLAHALKDLLGSEQIDAAELVVLSPVAPRGAGRALHPPLRHSFSFRRRRSCNDRLV